MRISIEWLKEFVDLKETPDALADMLSMLGFESEVAHDFSLLTKVVVGKVVTAKKQLVMGNQDVILERTRF